MILGSDPRRLGIFFFYDGEGVVDRYIKVMLEGLQDQLSELIVVANGKLNDEGREKLSHYARRIIVRDNKGLDVWAYKTALDHYGWAALQEFDELVLFNATIMGPIFPFEEMFSEMAGRDLDFWGPTWFHAAPSEYRGEIDELRNPKHLQSHFHVYRRSLVASPEFQAYWDELPEMRTYLDSVTKHEIPFTRHFQDLGYRADAYVNTDDLEGYTYQPIIFAPVTLIRDKRCPIIKRRSFFHDYNDVLDQSVGTATRELYDYLHDHTDFDTDLIWENLLRTNNLADLVKNLQLTYILHTQAVAQQPAGARLALVMPGYYTDLLPQLLPYAASMPAGCDLIVTVDSEAKAETVREAAAGLPYELTIIPVKNRGRDVAALLVGCGSTLLDYDLICFIHDKKVTQIHPGSIGDGFATRCFENVLATPNFVSNVIATFQAEPRLGVLTPSAPHHGDYFPISAFSWGPNDENTKELLATFGLSAPIDPEKEAIAPFGSTFWFRPEAIRPLLERKWVYADFPPEPLPVDGSISHAIERVYCYMAQARGYYSGWLFSDTFARAELTALAHYTREYTRAVADRWQAGTAHEMIWGIRNAKSTRQILKSKAAAVLPRSLRPAARQVWKAVSPMLRRSR